MITLPADFKFEPKVWSDHIKAFFDHALKLGAYAVKDDTLENNARSGMTINFPFFKSIGPAETPKPNVSLIPDAISDDSFQCSVFEAGKAVAATTAAELSSAATKTDISAEIMRQMARVMAEKVDDLLNDEIHSYNRKAKGVIGADRTKYDNMIMTTVATQAGDTMEPAKILQAKLLGFGERSEDAKVVFMHPAVFLDLQSHKESGFLKADANSPYNMISGAVGKMFNMDIVLSERCKKLPDQIGGKDAYVTHIHKANSFGIIQKQSVLVKHDEDILARTKLFASTQWFGVKSFDRKNHVKDNKAAGLITTVENSLYR